MGFPTARRNTMLDTELTGTMYLAAFTTAPDNEGASGVEVSAADYTRLAINLSSVMGAAAAGVKANTSVVEWAAAAVNAWGTIVRFALYTAATGGTFRARSDNSVSTAIEIGDTLRIPVGYLSFTLANKTA